MTDQKVRCLAYLAELTISPDKSVKTNELTHSTSLEIQIFTPVSFHPVLVNANTLISQKNQSLGRFFFKVGSSP